MSITQKDPKTNIPLFKASFQVRNHFFPKSLIIMVITMFECSFHDCISNLAERYNRWVGSQYITAISQWPILELRPWNCRMRGHFRHSQMVCAILERSRFPKCMEHMVQTSYCDMRNVTTSVSGGSFKNKAVISQLGWIQH